VTLQKAPESRLDPPKTPPQSNLGAVRALLPVETDATQLKLEPGQIRQLARFKGPTYGNACSVYVFAGPGQAVDLGAICNPWEGTIAIIQTKKGNTWNNQSYAIPFQGLSLEVAADEINVSIQNTAVIGSGMAYQYLVDAAVIATPLVRTIYTATMLAMGTLAVQYISIPKYCTELKIAYFGSGSGMVVTPAIQSVLPILFYKDWTPIFPYNGTIGIALNSGIAEILTR
jgi:hypothetical protein